MTASLHKEEGAWDPRHGGFPNVGRVKQELMKQKQVELGMVGNTHNPSIKEAEPGKSQV
jgi:hypothetical protein